MDMKTESLQNMCFHGMDSALTLKSIDESCQYIYKKTSLRPRVAITLGSGLASWVKNVDVEVSLPFSDIPHFPLTTVDGHRGSMIFGHLHSQPILVMQGRIHYYEGYTQQQVIYPTRCLKPLGIETLILTNASGGLDPQMAPGHFMLIKDHINLTGTNPLIGPNIVDHGPRFPDMSQPYDLSLLSKAQKIMKDLQLPHSEGVYCGVLGPSYETASEVQFLQKIGGHAVGMSTVSESIAAAHMGMKVCGISCITNMATGLTRDRFTHEDVTVVAQSMEKDFGAFMGRFITSFA